MFASLSWLIRLGVSDEELLLSARLSFRFCRLNILNGQINRLGGVRGVPAHEGAITVHKSRIYGRLLGFSVLNAGLVCWCASEPSVLGPCRL